MVDVAYIGADPEVFIRNKSGRVVPAEGIIPGTKTQPHSLSGWNFNYGDAIQVDGVAAEFNIAPHNDRIRFVNGVARVFGELKTRVVRQGYEIDVSPVAEFTQEEMDSFSDETKELGCNPDFNAWTKRFNPMPKGDRLFRTGSGHIHVGFSGHYWSEDVGGQEHMEKCIAVVKELDYYLGVPSLLWDKDDRRRELYGKAGCFRPKNYGLEYRVLSNAWVGNNELTGWIYDTAQFVVNETTNGKFLATKHENLAQQIIDKNELDWLERYGNITGRDLPRGF